MAVPELDVGENANVRLDATGVTVGEGRVWSVESDSTGATVGVVID